MGGGVRRVMRGESAEWVSGEGKTVEWVKGEGAEWVVREGSYSREGRKRLLKRG